jgi:hypothetical protein
MPHEGVNMKKYIGVIVCAVAFSVPSFAAEHLVSRSVKLMAKDTYKVTKVAAEKGAKATESVVKFVF